MTPGSEQWHARIEKRESGCWEWTGSKTAGGYGNLRVENGWNYSHRVAYELANGPIPDGLVIDHLCRNRLCCNPEHLEAIEHGENTRRGLISYAIRTTCKAGKHDITNPENVRVRPDGMRHCAPCDRESARRRYAASKQQSEVA